MAAIRQSMRVHLWSSKPAWTLKATWEETREVLDRTLRTEGWESPSYTSNSYSGTIASLQARGFVLEPLPSAVSPVAECLTLFARGYKKLGCRPNANLLGTRTRLLSIRPESKALRNDGVVDL